MSNNRYQWDRSHPGLTSLQQAIEPLRQQVVTHPIYGELDSIERVRIFLGTHVFAVWDFMCLLKSLQTSLTCVQAPWFPTTLTSSTRLINEIVMVEESDEYGDGYISHFELYRKGMSQAGAASAPLTAFLELLRLGVDFPEAAEWAGIPAAAAAFVGTTWDIIETAPTHCQAAAFAFGREDLIPEMFKQVIQISDTEGCLDIFKDYLARHIEVDGEQHTPMAMQMLIDLCGDDQERWDECVGTVRSALQARVDLWTAIVASFPEH
ncbi:MAG TPA: DUF3050 domain-containing protein [Actinocrinis sp.]|nr:DUF3050 domain-containing protein [Actinocrinis sp.]